MPKVKALYHFKDKTAYRNRKQGDVFDVSEERVKELVKAGVVILVEPTKENEDTKPVKNPDSPPKDNPPKKQASTKKSKKK